MVEKPQVCLVSCSILREEIAQLIKQGSLKVDLVFVSKLFHVDYEALNKNLRKVLEQTLRRFKGKVVLVYGDLCLGPNNEMKMLAEEYGVVKVDAVNCVDCQLGGKGKSLEADLEHNLMFMGPGMIDFFKSTKEAILKEGYDETTFANLFSGIKGLVLLDTCNNAQKMKEDLEISGMGLPILETRQVGLENVRQVILDAIERATCSK